MTIQEMFYDDSMNDEYLMFDRIPASEQLHPRPDLCAMLFLHQKLGHKDKSGGNAKWMRDMVAGAEHDEILLDYDESDCEGKLTRDDVMYLSRCGVMMRDGSLCMLTVESVANFVPSYSSDFATAAELLASWEGDIKIRRRDGRWWCELCLPSEQWECHGSTIVQAVARAMLAAARDGRVGHAP